MKKHIGDIFDSYTDKTVIIKTDDTISAEKIIEMTKNKIEEDKTLNIVKSKKKWAMPLVAAAVLVALSCTAFAARYFLAPSDIARRLDRYELAECFTKDDTMFNLAPQTSGDYTIALLGMVSGRNLEKVTEVDTNQTYIVGAISKSDGSAINDYTGFMVTPLVKGYKPWQVNVFTLGGGRSSFLYEGVEYFIIECDNVEIFADKTVYIAAYEGMAPSLEIFAVDGDGAISFNESYTGFRALFEAPLDKSKANPAAVKQFLEENGFSEEGLNLSVTERNKDDAENGQSTEKSKENYSSIKPEDGVYSYSTSGGGGVITMEGAEDDIQFEVSEAESVDIAFNLR